MDKKRQRSQEEHPELTPYAPPQHPDTHVPEQQFDADQPVETKPTRKRDKRSK